MNDSAINTSTVTISDDDDNIKTQAELDAAAWEAVMSADSETKANLAFSLQGKINGRIMSFAMRGVGRQRAMAAVSGIDGYNAFLADLEAATESDRFREEAGFEPELDWRHELACWIGIRARLGEAGFAPQDLAQTAEFLFLRSVENDHPQWSEEQLQQAAKETGVPLEILKAEKLKDRQRDIGRTKERLVSAVQLAMEVGPDYNDLPTKFADTLHAAVQSAKRGAVRRAAKFEDCLGDLLLLNHLDSAT